MESLTIVKIGGNIIDDESRLLSFMRDFAGLPGHKILVHGGGKLATRMAEKLEIPQQLVEGRRITDAETLRIVTMVYAGYINKNIVAGLQAEGCPAMGLCGADGNLIRAHKREKTGIDYGFAGDIDEVNSSLIDQLLKDGLALVLAPITHDRKGQLLNTNADTLAQEAGSAMCRLYSTTLVFSFEKSGVLLDAEDENTVIATLTRNRYQALKKEGRIFAGMIPKLDNAFEALDCGINKVIIGRAEDLERLCRGMAGTTIIHD